MAPHPISCPVEVFETAEDLAGAAARQWLDLASAHREPKFCTALSGGRLAASLFNAMRLLVASHGLLPATTHFFFADERCVPPDHPESNYRLAREHLFGPLNLPAAQIHRLAGEMEPSAAAALAGAELRRMVGHDGDDLPALDLVFLGMGEDGHIASIFPDAPLDVLEGRGIYAPVIGPKPPPQRITLTMPMLAGARRVWVLISGAGKNAVLEQSLHGTRNTPLGLLLRQRQSVRLMAEFRAVSAL